MFGCLWVFRFGCFRWLVVVFLAGPGLRGWRATGSVAGGWRLRCFWVFWVVTGVIEFWLVGLGISGDLQVVCLVFWVVFVGVLLWWFAVRIWLEFVGLRGVAATAGVLCFDFGGWLSVVCFLTVPILCGVGII